MWRHAGVLGRLWLVALIVWPVQAAVSGEDVAQRYRADWSARVLAARGPDSRADVARAMLQDALARREDDPELALHTAGQAFVLAKEQIRSFSTAAKALALMSELDPRRRLTCLEEVADLYRRAYPVNPSPELGAGMAESVALTAREKRRRIEARVLGGDGDPAAWARELDDLVRDWERARRTLADVMIDARRRQLRQKEGGDQAAEGFVQKHTPLIGLYETERDRDAALRDGVQLLSRLIAVDDQPVLDQTQRAMAGWLFLAVRDDPAGAMPYAGAFLDRSEHAMLALAVRASQHDGLSASEKRALGAWYDRIGQRVPMAVGRRRMLARGQRLLAEAGPAPVDGQEASVVAVRPEVARPVASEVLRESAPEPVVGPVDRPIGEVVVAGPEGDGGRAGEGATVVAAVPGALPKVAWLDDDETDAYWAGREKSIFDFGLDD